MEKVMIGCLKMSFEERKMIKDIEINTRKNIGVIINRREKELIRKIVI